MSVTFNDSDFEELRQDAMKASWRSSTGDHADSVKDAVATEAGMPQPESNDAETRSLQSDDELSEFAAPERKLRQATSMDSDVFSPSEN